MRSNQKLLFYVRLKRVETEIYSCQCEATIVMTRAIHKWPHWRDKIRQMKFCSIVLPSWDATQKESDQDAARWESRGAPDLHRLKERARRETCPWSGAERDRTCTVGRLTIPHNEDLEMELQEPICGWRRGVGPKVHEADPWPVRGNDPVGLMDSGVAVITVLLLLFFTTSYIVSCGVSRYGRCSSYCKKDGQTRKHIYIYLIFL
jgi:hypothetical protein